MINCVFSALIKIGPEVSGIPVTIIPWELAAPVRLEVLQVFGVLKTATDVSHHRPLMTTPLKKVQCFDYSPESTVPICRPFHLACLWTLGGK